MNGGGDTPVAVLRSRPRLSPRAQDVLLAVTILVFSIINVSNQDQAGFDAIPVLGFVLFAGASGLLLWRRGLPLVVLAGAVVMTVVWTAAGYPGNPVFHVLTALYAVGRYCPDIRYSYGGLVLGLAIVAIGQIVDDDAVSDIVTALIVTVLPWYIGRRMRARGLYAAAVQEQRAAEAERAITDARAAIARELHDVVAHNVSVMTVQAGVARLTVADDPDRAEEAIGAVEEAGRRALDELRHLLGVLRPESGEGLEPQPALHQLEQLVGQLRQTGMTISMTKNVASELPVRVDLFAFRIVQEALTNVLKHGGPGATADVRIAEANGHLDVEVTNTGKAATSVPGAGRGIVGMKERATLLGGTFVAGPQPGGGFRVEASLPIGAQ